MKDVNDRLRDGTLPDAFTGAIPFRVNGHAKPTESLPPFASEQAAIVWATPQPPIISTGLSQLDELLGGGLESGSTYGLCAGTGHGKTGLAIRIASDISRHRSVVYFTSELPERQVLARVAAQVLRRPWRELNRLTPEGGVSLIRGALEGLRLRVIELRGGTDITGFLSRIADVDGEAPLLFLDYLQHAARRGNPDDRRLAVAALSDTFASWARDVKSTAFIVSSVARAQYVRDENRPASGYVGSAKESGDIEFDASAIMFLDTVVDGVAPGAKTTARLHLAKSRFGTTGTIGLSFDGAIGLFTSDAAGAMTTGQREVIDAIRDGATTAADVAREVGRRKSDVLATIAVLRTQNMIGIRPLRVLQSREPWVPTDGSNFANSEVSGTGNFSVPVGSQNQFSVEESGSGVGNPPSGGCLGSHPVGVTGEPGNFSTPVSTPSGPDSGDVNFADLIPGTGITS